ncbi:toxin glutamine deamidase domain-containing protein [Kitasatospora sp. NPDC096147]|uniref:toxin glutamine deamidase domain-containing protein n=1 Tax=Kitasatospora sp. NPDC096147 TaxID=3364093 RepID=UPI0037F3D09F
MDPRTAFANDPTPGGPTPTSSDPSSATPAGTPRLNTAGLGATATAPPPSDHRPAPGPFPTGDPTPGNAPGTPGTPGTPGAAPHVGAPTAAHPTPTSTPTGNRPTAPSTPAGPSTPTGPVPSQRRPDSDGPTFGPRPAADRGPVPNRPDPRTTFANPRPDIGNRLDPNGQNTAAPKPDSTPRPDLGNRLDPEGRSTTPPKPDTTPRPDLGNRLDPNGQNTAAPKPDSTPRPDLGNRLDPEGRSTTPPKPDTTPHPDLGSRLDPDGQNAAPPRPDTDTGTDRPDIASRLDPSDPSDPSNPSGPSDPSGPDTSGDTPRPLADSRPYDTPGGLDRPDPQHQQDLESRIPRDPDGTPQRHPDPNGDWPGAVNGDGHRAPGRDNNCLDVALSTADTYSGNPTAAASRNDSGPDGEHGGRDRAERQLGAPFRDMGNGDDAFRRIEDQLRDAGHGSQAVIVTQDANGRAHAWNVVNHDGKITYLDNQTGQRGDKPLHDGDHGVFAVPLDPDRRPIPADATPSDRPKDRQDDGTDRRPADPAGQQKPGPDDGKGEDGKDEQDPKQKKPSLAEQHKDDPTHPIHEPARTEHERLAAPEKPDDTVYGLKGDEVQRDLRTTNDVRPVGMEYVYDRMNEWADSGDLGRALDRTTGDNPMTLRRSDLEQALPGFRDMHPGEQGAVVAAMGRMSDSFHQQHGVGVSPEPKPYPYSENPDEPGPLPGQDEHDSRGGVDHEVTKSDGGLKLSPDSSDLKREIKETFGVGKFEDSFDAATHRPDFTGKNYAVLEVWDPTTKQISYVVESSVPASGDRAGITPLHSETHAGNWIRNLNNGRSEADRYQVLSLYTEREPCGRGPGHANCSGYLAGSHEGVPVHYGTGYRKGEKVGPTGMPDKLTPRQHMNRDFGDHVAEVARIWLVTEQQRLDG